MIQVYSFQTSRGKFKYTGKTPSALKKELFNLSNKCYLCNNEFELRQLELEHKIPVELGGHLFSYENVSLCCIKCHRKKTIIDKRVIHFLKSIKIIFSKGESFLPLNELHEKYNYLFDLTKKGLRNYDTWLYGSSKEDYIQNVTEENRI